MSEDETKYLDPDQNVLERDPSPDDRFLDPDLSPLEPPSDPIYDPDLSPLDGSDELVDLYRENFGGVEDVQLDELKLRRSGQTIKLYERGEWREIPEDRREEVIMALQRFRQKRAE